MPYVRVMSEKRGFNRQEAIAYFGVKAGSSTSVFAPIVSRARIRTAVIFESS